MTTHSVVFSPQELRQGALCGVERRLTGLSGNLAVRQGAREARWDHDIDGAAAEVAFAKFTNRFWNSSVGTFRAGDVGDWHIRQTRAPDGHLVVRPYEQAHAQHRYALVITQMTAMSYACTVVGWAYGGEICQPNNWREDMNGFWMPQHLLHPFAADGTPCL